MHIDRQLQLLVATGALISTALAQLYPAEPLDVAYSDLPETCVGTCQSFQDVFLPCKSFSDGSLILGPDPSYSDLSACVCTDEITQALTACYDCNEDNGPGYRLASNALTTIGASAINYDRLCGTTISRVSKTNGSSAAVSFFSAPSTGAATPSFASLAAVTTTSSSSAASTTLTHDSASSTSGSSAASASPTADGNDSAAVGLRASSVFFVGLAVVWFL
ncbi:hypothetical protein JCM6882_000248 [Rhodosporidiobolus microsporus]